MENQNNRLITYPSTVEKTDHHTVVLIDCDTRDFSDLLLFLKTSKTNFDVYTYRGDMHDLEWLNNVSKECDVVLIDNASQVKITPEDTNIRYGVGLGYQTPYGYFTKLVDKNAEISV